MMLAKAMSPTVMSTTATSNHTITINTIGETCQQIREHCARRTLIVCGKSMLRLGYTHDVIRGLHDMRIHYTLFSDVVNNASSELEGNLLATCATLAKEERVDSIVGIGGKEVIEFVEKLQAMDMDYVPVYSIKMD